MSHAASSSFPSPSTTTSLHWKNSPIVSTRHRTPRSNAALGQGRHSLGNDPLRSDLTRYNLGSPRVPFSSSSSLVLSSTARPNRPTSCPPTFDPVPPYPGVTYSPDSRPVIPIPISSSSPRSPHQIQPATSRSSSSSPRPLTTLLSPPMNRHQAHLAQPVAMDGASALYGDRRVPTLPYNPPPPCYDDLYGPDPNKPLSRLEAIARIARMVGRELVGGNK